MSVKQLCTYTVYSNEEPFFNGVKLWNISIIGYTEILKQNDDGSVKFNISDGTAKINAVLWKDNIDKETIAGHIR